LPRCALHLAGLSTLMGSPDPRLHETSLALLAKICNVELDRGAGETKKLVEQADAFAFVIPFLFDTRLELLRTAVELSLHLCTELEFVTELSNGGGIQRMRMLARYGHPGLPEVATIASEVLKCIKGTVDTVSTTGFIFSAIVVIQSGRRRHLVYRFFRPIILQRRAAVIMLECAWRCTLARRIHHVLYDAKEERDWRAALVELARRIADEALWEKCRACTEALLLQVVTFHSHIVAVNEMQEHLMFKYGAMAPFFIIKLQVAVKKARHRRFIARLMRVQSIWRGMRSRREWMGRLALAMAERKRRIIIRGLIENVIVPNVRRHVAIWAARKRWSRVRTSIIFAGNLKIKLRKLEEARAAAAEAARIAEEARIEAKRIADAAEQVAWEAAEVELKEVVAVEAARLVDLRLMTQELNELVLRTVEEVLAMKAAEEAISRRLVEEASADDAEQAAWEAVLLQLDQIVAIEAARLRLARAKAAVSRGVKGLALVQQMEKDADEARIRREEEARVARVEKVKAAMARQATSISLSKVLDKGGKEFAERRAIEEAKRAEEERVAKVEKVKAAMARQATSISLSKVLDEGGKEFAERRAIEEARRAEEERVAKVEKVKGAMTRGVASISLSKVLDEGGKEFAERRAIEEARLAAIKAEEERVARVEKVKAAMGKGVKSIAISKVLEDDAKEHRLERTKAAIARGRKKLSMLGVLQDEGAIYAERTAELQTMSASVVGSIVARVIADKKIEDAHIAAIRAQEVRDKKVFDDLTSITSSAWAESTMWAVAVHAAESSEATRLQRLEQAKASTARATKMLAAKAKVEAEAKAARLKRTKAAMKRGVASINNMIAMEKEGLKMAERRADENRRAIISEMMDCVMVNVHEELARYAEMMNCVTPIIVDLVEEVLERKRMEEAEIAREHAAWEAALEELDRIVAEEEFNLQMQMMAEAEAEARLLAMIAADEAFLQALLGEEAETEAEKEDFMEVLRKRQESADLASMNEKQLAAYQQAQREAMTKAEEAAAFKRRQEARKSSDIAKKAAKRSAKSKEKAQRAKNEAAGIIADAKAKKQNADDAEEEAIRAAKVAEAAEIGAGNSAPLAFEDEPLLPGQKKRTGKLSAAERRERREEEMRIREEQERQMLEEMAAREAERAAKEAERVAKQAEKEEAERIAKEAEKAAKELDLAARREAFLKDRAAKKKADAEKAAQGKAEAARRLAEAAAEPKKPKVQLAAKRKGEAVLPPPGISVVMSPRTFAAAEKSARMKYEAMAELGLGHMATAPLMPLLSRNRNPANDLYHSLGLQPPNYATSLFEGIQSSAGPARWVQQMGAPAGAAVDAGSSPRNMGPRDVSPPGASAARNAPRSAGHLRTVASVGALPALVHARPGSTSPGRLRVLQPSSSRPLLLPVAPLPVAPSSMIPSASPRGSAYGHNGRLKALPRMNDLRMSLPPTELGMRLANRRERISTMTGEVPLLKETASAPLLQRAWPQRGSSPPRG